MLLKRGMSATLEEFLMAAEYIMSEGNYNVVLCERGVRTFADHTRNTLDLSIVPAVQRLSHLPIVVDPEPRHGQAQQSHAAVARGGGGRRRWTDRRSASISRTRRCRTGRSRSIRSSSMELMAQVRQIAAVVGREIVGIGAPAVPEPVRAR